MLTLYSVVKGFGNPHTAIIQRNAIQSWQAVLPGVEIVLFGDDEPGAKEEARRFGLPLLHFERNEHGAPLVSDVISTANELVGYNVRCLINADIILEPSFADAVRTVADKLDTFLLIMQRLNIGVEKAIGFAPGWHARIRELSSNRANTSAIDVFCYRGDWLSNMPAFGMGRTSWDNWIVCKASDEGVPVVSGSEFTKAWHQNHKKTKHPGQIAENRALLKKKNGSWKGTLGDANWKLTKHGELKEL